MIDQQTKNRVRSAYKAHLKAKSKEREALSILIGTLSDAHHQKNATLADLAGIIGRTRQRVHQLIKGSS